VSTDPAHPDDDQEQLLVPLAAEDVAVLGSDGEQLAALFRPPRGQLYVSRMRPGVEPLPVEEYRQIGRSWAYDS
jgi:hypothetical protein